MRLTGRQGGADRGLLPQQDADEQPDDPGRGQAEERVLWQRVGGREARGSGQPAHYEPDQASQSHEVADRPGDSRGYHDRGGEQHQREAPHEVLIAGDPPLHPPDGQDTGVARRLLRRRRARPGVHRMLEGDPIHGIQDARENESHPGRNGTEEGQPAYWPFSDVEREEQDQQSSEVERRADELAEVYGGPIATGGVVGEGGFERRATSRVENNVRDTQEDPTDDQQRHRCAKQRAVSRRVGSSPRGPSPACDGHLISSSFGRGLSREWRRRSVTSLMGRRRSEPGPRGNWP